MGNCLESKDGLHLPGRKRRDASSYHRKEEYDRDEGTRLAMKDGEESLSDVSSLIMFVKAYMGPTSFISTQRILAIFP